MDENRQGRHFDLEDRLVEYSATVIDVVEAMPATRAGNYLAGQLVRCGLAPAMLYGEAQGAESRVDFVHKMKIGLKELKETRICLKIIHRKKMVRDNELLMHGRTETEELIAIFAKSIVTAKNNLKRQNMKRVAK